MTAELKKYNIHLKAKLEQLESLIGRTPLVTLNNIFQKPNVKILAKLEWQQLGGSVKSRPAFHIIKDAIYNGKLTRGKSLLDASSGNTGIAYASICAKLGIPLTLCLPENASDERKQLLESLGTDIIYTSRFDGTDGAQLKAKEIFKQYPDKYYYADQYANDHNWKAHFRTTATEIWSETKGEITHFINGLGTTGTFTGTGRRLKAYNPHIQLIALHPNNPMHGLEGWKHMETAIVPKIYDNKLADENRAIDTLDAYSLIKEVAEKENLMISPSAAANLKGAIDLGNELSKGVIVTTFADNAEKYSEVMKQIF